MPFAFIGAIAGGASLAAAAAFITIPGILAVTAVVGVGLSVVGTITKDPILRDIGIGLSVIGSVGSLAVSAGLVGVDAASTGGSLFGAAPAASTADASTSAFGAAASDASSASGYGATSAFDTGSAAGSGAGTAAGAGAGTAAADATPPLSMADNSVASDGFDPANQISAGGTSQPLGEAPINANAPNGVPAASNNLSTALTNQAVAQTAPAAPGAPPVPASLQPGAAVPGTVAAPAQAGAVDGALPDAGTAGGTASSSGLGGVANDLLDFATKNPVVTLGLLQAGGSLLSGLTSSLTPAQVAALNSQAAANNAAASLSTQQQQNLAMPKAVASSTPVTSAPGPLTPATTPQPGLTAGTAPTPGLGFMNNAPTPTQTGVAA